MLPVLVAASPASAEEPPKDTSEQVAAPAEAEAATPAVPDEHLEEFIEVEGQRESEAERRRKSAESVQVLETEQLQHQAADMGEALARGENVGVRRSGGLGSRTRFSLAGLTDEQIRFFIDGVPLELAGFGAGIANVPVNLVQRVEIYSGVVPGRFGADALGGAVHLVTDQEIGETGATASYELGSYGTHRLTASARHLHEPSGLLVRAHGFFDRAKNDYPIDVEAVDAQGRLLPVRVDRFHDAYQAAGGSVEVGLVDRPWARRLLLRAFMGQSAKEIQHNVSMEVPYGEVDGGETSRGATLRFEQLFSDGLSADAVAGYTWRQTRFEDLSQCAYDWFGTCVQPLPLPGEMEEARAVDRFVGQHTSFARFNLGWTSAYHALRLSLAPTLVRRVGEDRSVRARQELDPLSGERGMFSLVTGLEYELDALDYRFENIVFVKDYLQFARADRLLPSGVFADADRNTHEFGLGDSARLVLTPELTAKASYEWATRLPRPDEIFGDGILVSENLDLQPETSHNVNLGLSYEPPATSAGTFRANVTGFGRMVDQFIVFIGQEGYYTYENVFAARSLGVAGALGWVSPGEYVALDGNATWQDLRNVSSEGKFGAFDGQRVTNRPYLMANASARFQLGSLIKDRDELSLTWHSRYVHEFFRGWEAFGLEEQKLTIPSQFLHSLALTYVVRELPSTVSVTLDVQNLTDASAFDFFGVQRPGRSFFTKLTFEL